MIIEIFIVILLALKFFGVIDISWTVVTVVSVALVMVEIKSALDKKALLNGVLGGSKIITDKIDDIEFRLESKQDREL
jgi:hypothetical protein